MTQAEALDKLIAAVEAGALPGEDWRLMHDIWSPRNWHDIGHNVRYSMGGSLDAAKALHEALLPGWDYIISRHDAEMWQAGCYPDTIAAQIGGNPARAWLLAVLKAYRAGL